MIIAPFFMVLSAATAIAHLAPGNQAPFVMAHSAPGNQTFPESNVLPPDKHFPKVWIQEVVRRECPKAGDIPELHLPDKREYSVQTYVDKYNEVMGRRCDKNPQHRLHRRAFKTKVEATTYLGISFNIGDVQYILKRDQQGGRSIIDRSPLPEACYTNMGGSLYTSYATFADSAYQYSDEMAASANVDGGYGPFGASVHATAGNSETLSKDVLYYRYDGLYITEVVAFNSLCLREFLNPELKNDLLAIEHQDLPIDDATHPGYLPYIRLIEKWGTHYVTTQQSGGSYELTMTSDKVHFSKSIDFAASVRKYLLKNVSVGGSKEESEKLDSAKSTLKVAVSGGRRKAVNNLTNAFREGDRDAMDEATGRWLKSVAHGAKGPQQLHYEPVFRDVIPHVYVDDYVRQAAFLENLKQVERIVSRRAWKNYCVPAMWDEERLTCEVDKPVAIIGIWVHLYQANRHCFYYKDNQIQVLKNRTGSGCSAFRYTERGTIEVDGKEGILMFESGNTHKATISKAVGFPDHYAKFRFTGLGRIVSVGAASADPISLYVDGGVLHLGPRPLNLKEEMYRFSAVPIADQSKPAPPVPSVPVQKKSPFADQSKPALSVPSVPVPQLTIFTWTQTNSKEVWLKTPFLAAYHEDEKRARYVGMVINTSPVEHGQMAAGIVGEIADDGILYASSTSIPYGGSYYPLREERYAVLSCNNPEAVIWLQVHGKASEATIPKGYELFVADRTSYDVDIYVARNLISHDVGWSSSAMEEMEFCVNNPNCEVESRLTSDYEVMIVKLPYKTFEM